MKITQHTARNDIYRYGLKELAKNKQGFTLDRSRPSIEKEDEILVRRGQVYYRWKRKRSASYSVSLEKPVFDFRTGHQRTLDEFRERLEESFSSEEERDEFYDQVSEYKEQCDESLNNIPEQLQESHILNQYIEELDSIMDEINSIEIEDE